MHSALPPRQYAPPAQPHTCCWGGAHAITGVHEGGGAPPASVPKLPAVPPEGPPPPPRLPKTCSISSMTSPHPVAARAIVPTSSATPTGNQALRGLRMSLPPASLAFNFRASLVA